MLVGAKSKGTIVSVADKSMEAGSGIGIFGIGTNISNRTGTGKNI
jgi:hypothetical protein